MASTIVTVPPERGAGPSTSGYGARRSSAVVAVASAAAATMFLAITTVLAAVPEIAGDLDATQRQLQWAADCYPLALASLLLPSGVLADRFGRKRFLVAGLSLLALGLLGASQARDPTMLLASLAVAGVGSGIGFPSTLASVTGVVDARRRPTAISVWAAAVPVGGLSGAMLTGAVLEVGTWPWAFGAAAVAAVACLLLALLVVPETRDPQHTTLDVPGALLSAAAVAALVVGLTEGPVAGWVDPHTLVPLAGAVVLGLAFVAWELRAPAPLLDVRLFAIPAFAAPVLAMTLMFGGLFGMVFLAYQWEAYVLGFRSLTAGIGLAPMAITMLPLALLGNRIARRIGFRGSLALALAAGCVGCVGFALSGQTDSYPLFFVAMVVFGACIGLSAGPGTDAISAPLPPARQGVASAVNDLARELGATLGIAISGTAFNAAYRAHVRERLDTTSDPLAQAVLTSPGAGERAVAAAGDAGSRHHDVLVGAASAGWSTGALVAAGAFLVALVLFLVFYPRGEAGRPAGPAGT
jgi:EmrB/QacA subfamily drug resistance transporter